MGDFKPAAGGTYLPLMRNMCPRKPSGVQFTKPILPPDLHTRNTSRAASLHPDPGFAMPAEAPPHGHNARRYLNTKVTGVLLEGMKQIAKEQCVLGCNPGEKRGLICSDRPKDPLRVLGEYLLQRSKELETNS